MPIPSSARPAFYILLLLPASLPAQQALDSGTVVRFRAPADSLIKAKLLSPYAKDSSRIRYCRYPAPPCQVRGPGYGDRLASEISRLEVRRGTGWLPGLIVGGAVGVGVGIFLINFSEDLGEVPLSDGEKARGMVGSAMVFGGLGALIGSLFERWGKP